MTAPRSRRERKIYSHHLKNHKDTSCQFCVIDRQSKRLVLDTKHFKIIRNIFPYSIWDSQGVTEHLLIVPKEHTDTLKDLNAAAAKEYVDLISNYEYEGYSIYARPPGSNRKTVLHQHTHIIKLDGKYKRMVFLLLKPYLRIVR